MSYEASAWALKSEVSRSAMKNLLMILAHLANDETGELYPSLAYLEVHTGLSRKTVIDCLKELESEEVGVLVRTGEMKGSTQSIPVYRFVCSTRVPRIKWGRGVNLHQSKSEPEAGSFLPGSSGVFTEEAVVKTPYRIGKGNREEEYTPPVLCTGHPQSNLFDAESGGEIAVVDNRGTLIEHVQAEWAKLVEQHPRIPAIKVMNHARKQLIARRASEAVRDSNGVLDAYQVWDLILTAIKNDPWLRGDGGASRNHTRPFVVDIDRVLRTSGNPNFLSIFEKATTNDQAQQLTHDPRTGRELGPAEQSAHAALALLRAADQQRAG